MPEIDEADVIATALQWASQFGVQAVAVDCHLRKFQRIEPLQDGSGGTYPVRWCQVDILPPVGRKVRVVLEELSGGFSPTDPPTELA